MFLKNNYDDILDIIREAAEKRKTVLILYIDSKGISTTREIEPYEIRNDNVYAYCLSRSSIRQFKISNIESAKITSRSFVPRWSVKI